MLTKEIDSQEIGSSFKFIVYCLSIYCSEILKDGDRIYGVTFHEIFWIVRMKDIYVCKDKVVSLASKILKTEFFKLLPGIGLRAVKCLLQGWIKEDFSRKIFCFLLLIKEDFR